jgi:hypothetical protein
MSEFNVAAIKRHAMIDRHSFSESRRDFIRIEHSWLDSRPSGIRKKDSVLYGIDGNVNSHLIRHANDPHCG